jgi:hypothetical protein
MEDESWNLTFGRRAASRRRRGGRREALRRLTGRDKGGRSGDVSERQEWVSSPEFAFCWGSWPFRFVKASCG